MGWLTLLAKGSTHAWIRIQLGPAAQASQCLTVFAASGAVYQTNYEFEHNPCLAHPLDAWAETGIALRIPQKANASDIIA